MINLLSIFDPDLRHDLLMCGGIDSRILNLISSVFGSHFPGLSSIVLIQRQHIYSSPWASNWVVQVFEFLKPLSLTHLFSDSELNGSTYGFDPPYQLDFGALAIAQIPDELTIRVRRGQTVIVTWIERTYEAPASYCGNVLNSIDCWNRRVRWYSAFGDNDCDFLIDSTLLLLNSLVINGDGFLVDITNEQKELILYDFLPQTLQKIDNHLRLSAARVLTGLTATVNTVVATFEGVRQYPYNAGNFGISSSSYESCPVILDEQIIYSDPLFQEVPDSYCLIYKEDNNGSSGHKPVVYYHQDSNSFSFSLTLKDVCFFEKWRKNLFEKNPTGYDVNDGSSLVPAYNSPEYTATSVLELSYPIKLNTETVIFRTVANNQPLDGNWFMTVVSSDYSYTFTSYPCLDKDSVAFKTSIGNRPLPSLLIPSNTDKKGYRFGFHFKTSNPLNNPYLSQSGVNSNYKVFASSTNNHSTVMRLRYNSVVVSFIGENYNLFSSSEVGLFKSSIDSKITQNTERYQGEGGTNIRYLDTTLNEITCKQAIKINVDFEDVQSANIVWNVVRDDADVTYESQNYGDVSLEVYVNSQRWNFWNNQELSQSIPLRRTLRISPLDNLHIVYTENSLMVINDSAMQTIIDSATFLSDLDNGDIMPVPKMLEEIHAALQADKYSENPLSPGSPRVWNLGMMIHAISMATGLNIDPDGKPRPVDGYVTYNDGDEVSDRFGRGQAGIEYRQVSGELTPFPGYLYNVLTPRFDINPFTGDPAVVTGGLLGCSNLFQVTESGRYDMSKAIGVDQSVGVVPSADGSYTTYEGLMDVVTESLYMHSHHSIVQMKTFINSQKGILMLQELFQAVGFAVDPKKFDLEILGQTVSTVHPGFADSSPTVLDLICLTLLQLAHLVPHTMALPSPTIVESSDQDSSGSSNPSPLPIPPTN